MEKIIEMEKRLEVLKNELENSQCTRSALDNKIEDLSRAIAETEESISKLPIQNKKKINLGIDVELKAFGKNGSGKTRLLSMLKRFLEDKGIAAKLNKKDGHKLIVNG